MRVQHNIMAMNAYRNYTSNVSAMKKNLERLSSGYKINRAGDDAAGLAISEKMRAQITGLETAQKNAKDGISLVQTAEGALTEVHDMLNRMVELATQSANGTYDNDTDRYQLQKEMNELKAEINRIADSANFNGIKLLDGSMSTSGGTAIIDIQNTAYQKASSADGAFSFEYLRNRPDAGQNGSQAYFEINLDDLGLKGVGGAAGSITISLTVGSVTLTVSSLTVQTTGMTAQAIASAIVAAIKAGNAGVAQATSAAGVGIPSDNETNGDCILIGGHVWKVGASNGKLTFTQVDEGFMTASDEAVIPDGLKVDINIVNGGSGAINWNRPNVNWNVQNTKYYDPSGAGLQARAEMTVDFAKIKDGDTITVGTKTYTIYLDASKPASNPNANGIYLKGIDLETEDGQKKALDKIVEALSNNGKWTAGNGGVQRGGKGVVSFQSLKSYSKDLTTETKVMNEFKYKSAEKSATVSFEVDPTMVKKGDTFTLNGITFEFTASDGKVTESGNIAVKLGAASLFDEDGGVDLTASGIAAKIASAVNSLKYSGGSQAMYVAEVEGDRITITANDNLLTDGVKENRLDLKVAGTSGSGLMLQIGDTADSYNQLRVNINDCHTISLGLDKISIAEQESAQSAISAIKDAINYVSDVRGTLGATQNRLDHTINNLSVMTENIQDAESTIRDTDIAEEMMAYTKNNILIQASQAMLAQANQVPQGVLQLLQ